MEELRNFVKKFEKYKNNGVLEEKDYLKKLVLQERNNNKTIECGDLAKKFGVEENEIQEIIDEINKEETEKNKKKPIKIKKKLELFKKIKEKFNKLIDTQDKKTIVDILCKIVIFGIPINFSLWCFIFNPFSWYSWFSYGYTFWFIKKELIDIIRSLWIR
ncbi:MAG: hypothetical protein ACFFG0_03035 [Candidatus Thorarchaeota archaeon]